MNAAIHRSIGEQPLYLLTGCRPRFPVGLTNQTEFDESDGSSLQRLLLACDCARDAVRKAQERWARDYDRGTVSQNYHWYRIISLAQMDPQV